jgi:hypothetical protein
MTRAEALEAAAAVIARAVPDIADLAMLLDTAGQTRLAAALRVRLAGRVPGVGGEARPDPEMWAVAAERLVGGGR